MTSKDTSLGSSLSSLRSAVVKTLRIGRKPLDGMANITHEINDISRRTVGVGGFSDIYSGTWRSSHGKMKVAIKVIRAAPSVFESGDIPRALRREISIWKQLSHPNIHVLCGVYEDVKRFGPAPALVSPWYANGDINKYIRDRADHPDVGTLKLKLFAEVASGLKFLHDEHIVHGDLKGGNVLISDDGTARLCDFGLSRLLLEHSQSTTTHGGKGTVRWMAPELLLEDGARPSYASDIWACGCLFIEVWSSVVPYHDKENFHKVILALSRGEPPSRPSDMPDAIWTIVQRCCDFDVTHRPSPAHVIADLNLDLVMERVYSMVTLGRPTGFAESDASKEIEISLRAADPQQLSKLWIRTEAELAAEVVRLFAIWGLSQRSSSVFEDAVFRWCITELGVGDFPLPAEVLIPAAGNDFFGRFISTYEPAKIRPLARLVERARPGLAKHFMKQFASPALGSPLNIGKALRLPAWFSDGNRIAAGFNDGTNDGTIRILDVANGATLHRLVGHTDSVHQVSVSPNGRLLASCSHDQSIRLWDAETGLAIGAPMFGHTAAVWSVAFSPDGQHIVSGSRDDTICVWSIDKCTTVLGPLRGHTDAVFSVAFSPDGSCIVSGSFDDTVRVWDARTGDPILTLSGRASGVLSVAYSSDGLRIVSGSGDSTVRIWDATTGQPVGNPLEGHSGPVWSVAYSPEGTRIASSSEDHTIRIWDTATGASIATIRGHTDWVKSVAFSSDGKRLASASTDGTVRIWDATDDWRRWDI